MPWAPSHSCSEATQAPPDMRLGSGPKANPQGAGVSLPGGQRVQTATAARPPPSFPRSLGAPLASLKCPLQTWGRSCCPENKAHPHQTPAQAPFRLLPRHLSCPQTPGKRALCPWMVAFRHHSKEAWPAPHCTCVLFLLTAPPLTLPFVLSSYPLPLEQTLLGKGKGLDLPSSLSHQGPRRSSRSPRESLS